LADELRIVAATEAHARALAPALRAADAAECRGGGAEPLHALLTSLGSSEIARAALLGDRPIAMWGLAPVALLGDAAVVWLLTAPEVEARRFSLLRIARREVESWLRFRSELYAFADETYAGACRLLESLGFRSERGATFEGGGRFRIYERRD
jgi:hypothetical protein